MNHPNDIPLTIEANTRKELIKKCLEINIKTGAYHHFFDFQKDGKRWICFFYENVSKLNILKSFMEETIDDRHNI